MDVTYWIQQFKAGTANYGFCIRDDVENNTNVWGTWRSSDYSLGTDGPVLIVDYTGGSSSGDAYEPNNSKSAAKGIINPSTGTYVFPSYYNLNAATLSANIHTPSDEDWFSFTVSSSAVVNVRLTNVPSNCDYELSLYNAAGIELFRSKNGSGQSEQVIRRVYSGTYYIRVWPYNFTYSSPTNYTLTLGFDADSDKFDTTIGRLNGNAVTNGSPTGTYRIDSSLPLAYTNGVTYARSAWYNANTKTTINFNTQSPSSPTITFKGGTHPSNDGFCYVFLNGTPVYPFDPDKQQSSYSGNWTTAEIYLYTNNVPSTNQHKINWVLTHEMGHALGLRHPTTFDDVLMYDSYRNYASTSPSSYEIRGINTIYG